MAFKSFTHVQSLSKVSKVLVRFAPNDLRAVGTKFVAYLFPAIFSFSRDFRACREFWRRLVNSEKVSYHIRIAPRSHLHAPYAFILVFR